MIFLLNDVVLDVDMRRAAPPFDAARLRALQLSFVVQLGCELFSARPRLQRQDGERARRLAALIVCKAPEVNAALFAAPRPGCEPAEVETRLASLDLPLIAGLYARQGSQALTPQAVDAEVWRRMAA